MRKSIHLKLDYLRNIFQTITQPVKILFSKFLRPNSPSPHEWPWGVLRVFTDVHTQHLPFAEAEIAVIPRCSDPTERTCVEWPFQQHWRKQGFAYYAKEIQHYLFFLLQTKVWARYPARNMNLEYSMNLEYISRLKIGYGGGVLIQFPRSSCAF